MDHTTRGRKIYDKTLLTNSIKKAESHNRRQEINEMWAQHTKSKKSEVYNEKHKRKRHASSDSDSSESSNKFRSAKVLNGNKKWAAELQKFEESLGDDRWGHGGYKELYPEEFAAPNNLSELNVEKWGHGGYKELYPQQFANEKHLGQSKAKQAKICCSDTEKHMESSKSKKKKHKEKDKKNKLKRKKHKLKKDKKHKR